MKIRVTTNRYGYMGLFQNSCHNIEATIVNSWGSREYYFNHMGRNWTLTDVDCEEVPAPNEKLIDVINTDLKQQGPIKSDGGSSTYYDLPVSEWLLYTLNERQKEGKCYIKTEEIIADLLGDSFDYGNLFKSMIRCKGLQDGTGGKAGNSVEYECNKMIYSVNKIKEKK